MELPISPLPTGTITLNGAKVEYHSLSRAQAGLLGQFEGDLNGADTYIIACGTDNTIEAAQAWREATDFETVGALVDAILVVSGLTTEGDDDNPKA